MDGRGGEGRGVMVLVICIQFLQTLVVMHVKGRLEAGGKGVWGWGGGGRSVKPLYGKCEQFTVR